MPPREQLEYAGPAHPSVRRYLALRRQRSEEPATVLEGEGVIRAALAHGATLEVVLVCPELLAGGGTALLSQLGALGIRPLAVSPRTFGRLSSRDGPDGLAAVARLERRALADLSPGRPALVLVLDALELPGNVGSLLRSASASGASAVLLTGAGTALRHPLIPKASVGAVFSVPVVTATEVATIEWLGAHGFQVVAADPAAARSYRDASYRDRVAVVLGSERHGLSAAWREAADAVLSIPMRGAVDSLNAGHAGALFLFEVAHRHRALGLDGDGRGRA